MNCPQCGRPLKVMWAGPDPDVGIPDAHVDDVWCPNARCDLSSPFTHGDDHERCLSLISGALEELEPHLQAADAWDNLLEVVRLHAVDLDGRAQTLWGAMERVDRS